MEGYRLPDPPMSAKARSTRKTPAQRKRAAQLLAALRRRYPDARCALEASAPHELLIATILSAQATDASVNKATPDLFKAYPTVAAFAAATPAQIEPFVRTINFWRNKSRAIVETARALQRDFGGEVPRSMEALLTLRGVARKTANVVLGNAFGMQEGVVVDTHVARLSKRMRLTRHTDPVKVERDLMGLFVPSSWCELSHLLISHGRAVCRARGPTCANDSICRRFCQSASAGNSTVSTRRLSTRA
jgi:endonuclease-3